MKKQISGTARPTGKMKAIFGAKGKAIDAQDKGKMSYTQLEGLLATLISRYGTSRERLRQIKDQTVKFPHLPRSFTWSTYERYLNAQERAEKEEERLNRHFKSEGKRCEAYREKIVELLPRSGVWFRVHDKKAGIIFAVGYVVHGDNKEVRFTIWNNELPDITK